MSNYYLYGRSFSKDSNNNNYKVWDSGLCVPTLWPEMNGVDYTITPIAKSCYDKFIYETITRGEASIIRIPIIGVEYGDSETASSNTNYGTGSDYPYYRTRCIELTCQQAYLLVTKETIDEENPSNKLSDISTYVNPWNYLMSHRNDYSERDLLKEHVEAFNSLSIENNVRHGTVYKHTTYTNLTDIAYAWTMHLWTYGFWYSTKNDPFNSKYPTAMKEPYCRNNATTITELNNLARSMMNQIYTIDEEILGEDIINIIHCHTICKNIKYLGKLYVLSTKTYNNSTWNTNKTWYIKVTWSSNSTSNVVNYVTTWGTTEAQNTANQFSSKTFTLTADNYTQYKTLLTAAANTEIAAAQAYLDIPDLVLPSNYSATYTKNGFSYTLAVTYTKVSGEKNKVVVASTIDGGAFGTNSTLTYTTQALANTGLATEQSNRITAMQNACNNSPANSSETYTKNGLNYTIAKQYVKNAGNTTVTVKCLLDGTQYSTDTQAVTAANSSNLTACTTKVNALVTTLKNILNNSPANTSETYSKGNMNFTVTKTYTKTAGNATATWITKCDGIQYGTGTQTIGVSDPGANITTLASTAGTSLTNLKTAIDGCPADSSEVITVNGFKYNLGIFYTKTAGVTTATAGAKLDGNVYGSTESTLSTSTWAANKTTLTTNANNHKSACRAIIDTSPANSAATYTVNGLSYNVGTEYSKAAGNSTATIKTTLDGVQQKSQTQNVSTADLANNIGACSSKGRTDLDALKAILDQSPADYDQTQHTIDGFLYTAGATFTKAINSSNVTVKIYCDGEVNETYTDTVGAASTANDIAALKADALTKVNTLVDSLQGLPAETVNWSVNGFNFVLLNQYTKNLSTHKLTITSFIDGQPYGTAETFDFDKDAMSTYTANGANRITTMKNAVANAPANSTAIHTVNGFSFNVGTNYEKALGSTSVYIKTMLDSVQTGTSSVVTYDVANVAAITSQAASDVAALKVALNASPANYANTHTKSGFGWRTGVNFSKSADDSTVTLQATLDGENYGNPVTQEFDVTNISALSTKASEMETSLNTTLTNVAPADTAENFTIRRFNFNIESCFVKTPGIKTVTTMVKLDGTQYDTYHQEDFNVNTATALNTYNNNLINTLKSRLTSVCPDDIHTTYSRNQFNFVIDAYFSKQPNTDVIDIEYNIDSADLVTNS